MENVCTVTQIRLGEGGGGGGIPLGGGGSANREPGSYVFESCDFETLDFAAWNSVEGVGFEELRVRAAVESTEISMGGCHNYGPFLGP